MDKKNYNAPVRQCNHFQTDDSNFDYGSLDGGNEDLFNKKKHKLTQVEKAAIAVLVFCLIFVLLLVLTICVLIFQLKFFPQQLCSTPACVIAGGQIINKMNLSTNPCDDFYQYACGQQLVEWSRLFQGRAKWNLNTETTESNMVLLKQALENVNENSDGSHLNSAFGKAKLYYNTCMNISAQNSQGNLPVLQMISYLGQWSLSSAEASSISPWSIEKALHKLHTIGGAAFFYFSLNEDMYNSSIYSATFSECDLTLPDPHSYVSNETTNNYHDLLVGYIVSVGLLLGGKKESLQQDAELIWQLEQQLARIYIPPTENSDHRKLYNKMTLQQLSDLMQNTIDIKIYLKLVFGDNIQINAHDSVIVNQPQYMKSLGILLSSVNQQVIQNYIVWRGLETYLPYMPEQFELLHEQFKSVLYGTQSLQRWRVCVDRTNNNLLMATGVLFVQQLGGNIYDSFINEMVVDLKISLIKTLKDWSFMDALTKSKAVKKAQVMGQLLGIPSYFMNVSNLDSYYLQIQLIPDMPLQNELTISKFHVQQNLNLYRQIYDEQKSEISAVAANAYYSLSHNIIKLTLGILQQPYYKTTFPKAYNFGVLGSVIGHEFVHGFDVSGHLYNEIGNLEDWWTNQSSVAYDKIARCFLEQYNRYSIFGKRVNGVLTLSENIADNGGLQLAYHAYSKWLEGIGGHEQYSNLPGLNMTEIQLLFLSYAQHWCTYTTEQYALGMLNTDVHAPYKFRVNGVLSNMVEFSEAFSCPANSPMNPLQKCVFFNT